MEHIRQYDWCASLPDRYFVDGADLDRSVTECILRNKFKDPLISSDSEEEGSNKIDWNEVFKQKNNEYQERLFIPGFKPAPPYQKKSALTPQQHYQCLKVLCAQYPHLLKGEFVPRPTKHDHKVFEDVKEIYEKEQKEYIDWAVSLWSVHCVRALRPKPNIEVIYEAEFKMRVSELESFPKQYKMAAQIPLETNHAECKIVFQKDLINVSVEDLPQIEYPNLTRRFSIYKPCSVPEPCIKHPCRFILPSEKEMSVLPLTEIHRELAQYAIENGSRHIASENALKCLVELDQQWSLPISVCEVIGTDGEKCTVIVIGSEFSINRECPRKRTHRACRHLLLYSFIPPVERARLLERCAVETTDHSKNVDNMNTLNDLDLSSDEEDSQLLIDMDTTEENPPSDKENETEPPKKSPRKHSNSEITENANDKSNETELDTNSIKNNNIEESCDIIKANKNDNLDDTIYNKNNEKNTITETDKQHEKKIEFYSCTCKESMFEKPPLRSYKKWKIENVTKNDSYDLIVHCPHKAKNNKNEVVIEPIPEYQLELGASKQSQGKTKSLALQLLLRRNANLINVRIEPSAGDIVTIEELTLEDMLKTDENITKDVSNILYSALDQLQGLLPGQYVLQHEASHGQNAMLFANKDINTDQKLSLDFDCSQLAEADEAKSLKVAPLISTTMLPFHKYRKILPCAFTPFDNMVAKETKKPTSRQKTPPQAIKWPKRKLRKRKKNNQ